MSSLIDVFSWICLLGGGFFAAVGGLGLLRMPDFYTRMHAASLIDTMGAGLILLGLLLQAGFGLIAMKLLMLAGLLFLSSPTATHALARAAMAKGVKPELSNQEDASSKP